MNFKISDSKDKQPKRNTSVSKNGIINFWAMFEKVGHGPFVVDAGV
jgi:hypothetical protein